MSLLTYPTVSKEAMEVFLRFSKQPWEWMRQAVYTEDAADVNRPVKPFPPYPYLKEVIEEMACTRTPNVLLIEKSRRMMISWSTVSFATWLAMHRKNRAIFIASRKEESSAELVGRCEFIIKNLPEWHPKPMVTPYHTKKGLTIKLLFHDSGSFIEGVPEGSEQLRQYAASLIVCDEFPRWESAEESWAAMRPTIESAEGGGGKIIIIGTPKAGSFMSQMLKGEI